MDYFVTVRETDKVVLFSVSAMLRCTYSSELLALLFL